MSALCLESPKDKLDEVACMLGQTCILQNLSNSAEMNGRVVEVVMFGEQRVAVVLWDELRAIKVRSGKLKVIAFKQHVKMLK